MRVDREDAEPKLIFVKFLHGITKDRERLEQLVVRDHDVTCYLAEAFKSIPEIGIPRPIASSKEHLMLITEFVEGVRLQDKIERNARFSFNSIKISELAADCARCGQWLSRFRESTQDFLQDRPPMLGDDCLGVETITRLIIDRLEELHLKGVISSDELRRLITQVEIQAMETEPEHLESAGVHGDFFPGNLLVQGDTVIGIDFVMFRTGSIYFDPTYFIFQLETLQVHPAYGANTIAALKSAFLERFAPEQASTDIWDWNPMCRILLVMHSTARLLKLVNASPLGFPRRTMARVHIRWTKKRLLQWVSGAER